MRRPSARPVAFRPGAVRGSADGFAVTGIDAAGNYVAYSSTGSAASWLPTTSLGPVASYQSAPSATVGAGGTVTVAGSTAASRVSQQAACSRPPGRRSGWYRWPASPGP